MSVKQIINEWHEMLHSGTIPVMEFSLLDGGLVTVNLELKRQTMYFCFNSLGDRVYLDGLTKRFWVKDAYHIHAKVALKHFSNLDSVLEYIHEDVMQYIYDNGQELE